MRDFEDHTHNFLAGVWDSLRIKNKLLLFILPVFVLCSVLFFSFIGERFHNKLADTSELWAAHVIDAITETTANKIAVETYLKLKQKHDYLIDLSVETEELMQLGSIFFAQKIQHPDNGLSFDQEVVFLYSPETPMTVVYGADRVSSGELSSVMQDGQLHAFFKVPNLYYFKSGNDYYAGIIRERSGSKYSFGLFLNMKYIIDKIALDYDFEVDASCGVYMPDGERYLFFDDAGIGGLKEEVRFDQVSKGEGLMRRTLFDGRDVFYAYKTLPAFPGNVFCVVKVPGVADIRRIIMLGILFIVVLAFFLVYPAVCYFSRSIQMPLRKVAKVFDLAHTGNFDISIQSERKDEFGELYSYINEFMRKMQVYTKSISGIIEMHREAEETIKKSETRLRSFMATSNQGFWEVNASGEIIDVNSAMCNLLGGSREDIVGKRVFDFVYDENRRRLESQFASRKRGVKGAYEIEFRRLDGGSVYCLCNSSPLFEGEKWTGSFSLITDITKRKAAEDEIQRLNEELEDRVKRRTAELEESLVKFQRAQMQVLKADQQQLMQVEKMQALGSLVAGVAHEINTPVGVGVTAASHLEQRTKEYLELYHKGSLKRSDLESYIKTAEDSTSIIMTNLRRASELIQSFKKVAVDQSNEKKRKFELKTYFEEVILSLKPNLKKTKVEVLIDCPDSLTLFADPGAISQIITNFVMNSLIHGFDHDQEGQITIRAEKTEKDVFITYSDNGKGIKEDNIKRVFEPFYTTKRGQGGSGLGMHIVYNLVTQTLGGTIEVNSIPNEKTSFTIKVPLEGKEPVENDK